MGQGHGFSTVSPTLCQQAIIGDSQPCQLLGLTLSKVICNTVILTVIQGSHPSFSLSDGKTDINLNKKNKRTIHHHC